MRLLIVGTGLMANAHAEAFSAIEGVEIVATVEPVEERRAAFAAKFGVANTFETIEAAIDWDGFDAVTNVTPDKVHKPTTMPFLAAGKHVLCEKPLATTAPDAREMAEAAGSAGVVNVVNLTYRNVAAIQRAREIVESGAIGEIRHVEASYLQSWLTQPAWGDWKTGEAWLWRLSTAHGSNGVLGDVGIHILDFATYGAGLGVSDLSARLQTFDKAPDGRIGEYVLDANDSFAMTARLENGALAAVHATRFASGHLNDLHLRLHGTTGGLQVTNSGDLGTLRICEGAALESAAWTDVALRPVQTNYQRFALSVANGEQLSPDFAHAAKLQAVLDACVEADASGKVVTL